jgi:hypothetical protein
MNEKQQDKTYLIKGFEELMKVLDKNEISRNPIYTGYGVEIYQDNKSQTQVIVNFRNGRNELTINRGF